MDLHLGTCLESVRRRRPLVVCITNFVTVNDCANALLAVGASPVMTDSPQDAGDLLSCADGLYLNIGTVTAESAELMFRAARWAKKRGIPVLLDPVGAGASEIRTKTAGELLDSGAIGFLRGNISEIQALAGKSSTIRGVDVGAHDDSRAMFDANSALAAELAKKYSLCVGVSGPVDRVTSGERLVLVENGDPLLPRICGTGCILSAVSAGFAAAALKDPLEAFAAAFALCGLAGERARALLGPSAGPSSMRTAYLDALYTLSGEDLDRGARIRDVKE
ncbi:MAG: hydroxyethylthiazole kinase [Thermoguttaceae bacterium]|nr:hydroxyethylthiazole kinase [Thermoguttaceae bacterium]